MTEIELKAHIETLIQDKGLDVCDRIQMANMCWGHSLWVYETLLNNKVSAKLLQFRGFESDPTDANPVLIKWLPQHQRWVHYAVLVPKFDLVIDVTLVQFGRRFNRVFYPINEYRNLWREWGDSSRIADGFIGERRQT